MDRKSLETLILNNEQQLYRIAKSILKNDEDCADAAQETIAKAFAALHTLKQDRYAKTWLIRILIHECYNILKTNNRNLPLEEETLSSVSASSEEYPELYEALHLLPGHLRTVLVLYYLEGYSIREIADILQVPAGTVKSRMSRGRTQLKQLLDFRQEALQ